MTNEKKLDVGQIAHSLSRSKPRREIHLCLCEVFPDGRSTEEISEKTHYTAETITGALIGDKDRYKPEDALVTIGLTTTGEEEHRGQMITVYRAISDGEDIDKLLKDYTHSVSLLKKLKDYAKKLEEKMEKKRMGI